MGVGAVGFMTGVVVLYSGCSGVYDRCRRRLVDTISVEPL